MIMYILTSVFLTTGILVYFFKLESLTQPVNYKKNNNNNNNGQTVEHVLACCSDFCILRGDVFSIWDFSALSIGFRLPTWLNMSHTTVANGNLMIELQSLTKQKQEL